MADYAFITVWKVEAPIERVWNALVHPEQFSSWWKSIQSVVKLQDGDANGIGAVYHYTWVTRLPYKLEFDMKTTRLEAPSIIEGAATGELEGSGLWELSREGDGTLVRYTWKVRTTKAWMNLLAPVARPAFQWNHDQVMGDGAVGLAKLLGVKVEEAKSKAHG